VTLSIIVGALHSIQLINGLIYCHNIISERVFFVKLINTQLALIENQSFKNPAINSFFINIYML
jgi:hypothetical protein